MYISFVYQLDVEYDMQKNQIYVLRYYVYDKDYINKERKFLRHHNNKVTGK
jgi:hypothetical protein